MASSQWTSPSPQAPTPTRSHGSSTMKLATTFSAVVPPTVPLGAWLKALHVPSASTLTATAGTELWRRSPSTVTTSFTVEVRGGPEGELCSCQQRDVPGCTDPAASNYNADATEDDGSCCFGNVLTINLYDSFGDGWSFSAEVLRVVSSSTATLLNSPAVLLLGHSDLCLETGCYTAQIVVACGSEGFDVTDAAWHIINSGAGFGLFQRLSCSSSQETTAVSCTVALRKTLATTTWTPTSTTVLASTSLARAAPTMARATTTWKRRLTTAHATTAAWDVKTPLPTTTTLIATIACRRLLRVLRRASLTLVMYDSYGDGWNANTLTIGDSNY